MYLSAGTLKSSWVILREPASTKLWINNLTLRTVYPSLSSRFFLCYFVPDSGARKCPRGEEDGSRDFIILPVVLCLWEAAYLIMPKMHLLLTSFPLTSVSGFFKLTTQSCVIMAPLQQAALHCCRWKVRFRDIITVSQLLKPVVEGCEGEPLHRLRDNAAPDGVFLYEHRNTCIFPFKLKPKCFIETALSFYFTSCHGALPLQMSCLGLKVLYDCQSCC